MAFKSLAEQWAANCLRSVAVSGSFAKLTAVSSSLAGGSDIDLFISLTSNCNGTMKELYERLYGSSSEEFTGETAERLARDQGRERRDRLRAGKHQGGSDEDHTLYVRRGDTWKKTNVQKHITYVLCSGYTTRSRR